MNVNFGLFPPIEGSRTKKADRKKLYTDAGARGSGGVAGLVIAWPASGCGGQSAAPSRPATLPACGAALGAIAILAAGGGAAARRGGGEFGAVERAVAVAVGARELAQGAHRPFLEAEPAVMIGVEPVEIAAARRRSAPPA